MLQSSGSQRDAARDARERVVLGTSYAVCMERVLIDVMFGCTGWEVEGFQTSETDMAYVLVGAVTIACSAARF